MGGGGGGEWGGGLAHNVHIPYYSLIFSRAIQYVGVKKLASSPGSSQFFNVTHRKMGEPALDLCAREHPTV